MSARKLPFLVEIPAQTDLEAWFQAATPVNPAFPNWERSFVSGHKSPLFKKVEHREFRDHPKLLLTQVEFLATSEGPPGHVHGGASAGLMDEILGVAVWHAKYPSLTQNLSLHYGRALPLGQVAYVLSEIKNTSEKTVLVEGTIYDIKKAPYVSAQGAFHRLTPDQLQKFNELKK